MDMPTYTPSHVPVPQGVVVVERASSAQHLGPKLNRTAADVVRFLMEHGEMVTAAQSLSDEMIELFALEIGAEIRLVDLGEEQEVELQGLLDIEESPGDSLQQPRPPVVTVMGHVDHGKTLLLDRIRNSDRVSDEAGGITQHIGAYQVKRNGQTMTFIDTPGHEAFTAMRARGADVTDIVVLVVAADDGVMPQTIEAISHAKAAEVPMLVAINKIDRPNADVQKAVAEVAKQGLVPEAWGGDTIYCEVSALREVGIAELLDELLLLAEVEELKSSPEGRAVGVVLESPSGRRTGGCGDSTGAARHLEGRRAGSGGGFLGQGPCSAQRQGGECGVGRPHDAGSGAGHVRCGCGGRRVRCRSQRADSRPGGRHKRALAAAVELGA